VYPVVQVLMGSARLVPTPRYFPLRLRLVRALHRLSGATGLFVPLAPLLLEMLQWSDLSKPPKVNSVLRWLSFLCFFGIYPNFYIFGRKTPFLAGRHGSFMRMDHLKSGAQDFIFCFVKESVIPRNSSPPKHCSLSRAVLFAKQEGQ
jgi:Noc2p family